MRTNVLHAFACMADEEYAEAYDHYVTEACEGIIAYVLQDDVRKEVSPEFYPLLDGFAPKFRFISLNRSSPLYGLPVLTQGPLRAMTMHFGRITEALKEVRYRPSSYQIKLRKSTGTMARSTCRLCNRIHQDDSGSVIYASSHRCSSKL